MAAARKKASPSKRSTAKTTTGKKSTAKKAPAKRSKAAAKTAAPEKASRSSSTTRSARSKSATAAKAAGKGSTPKGGSRTSTASKKATPMTATPQTATADLPKPRFNKDGLGYTKDFDLTFIKAQYEALQEERVRLTGQAMRLEEEAHQLVEEAEMGDVQFDDEGGEGDTMVVERERDLALSAQAREAVAEIDAALTRIAAGTYGYSVVSGRPIPKERLEAIPWAAVLVEEKVGGIGRR